MCAIFVFNLNNERKIHQIKHKNLRQHKRKWEIFAPKMAIIDT